MKRVLLASVLCFGVAVSADATCTEILFVADWIDIGGIWAPIFGLYWSCTVTADPFPPPCGGGFPSPSPDPPPPLPPLPPPPPPVPATVAIGGVETIDPYNPVVMVDVTSNAFSDPVANVQLQINGVGVGFSQYYGDGRYRFNITSIGNFADGTHQLTGKACSLAGGCGEGTALMTRFTPSPLIASSTINASWQEADPGPPPGPVTRRADYGHTLRQMYTGTSFTCPETGGNSHAQVRDSVVTISGYDPMPIWNAAVATHGTINAASYVLWPSANPIACTFPIQCSSQSGSSAGAFGYLPSVDEGITSFVIQGQSALFTNGSLTIPIP